MSECGTYCQTGPLADSLRVAIRSDVVALRDGVSMEFHQALSVAITHQDHLAVFQFHGLSPRGAAPWCLVSDRVSEAPHPAYAVIVTDEHGQIVFRETLRFIPARDAAASVPGLRMVRPDPVTALKLAELSGLLTDQAVCVPDEMAPELDGLRDALGSARRVTSLLPQLSRIAQGMGARPAAALVRRMASAFSLANGRAQRAECIRRVCLWADRRRAG